MNTQATQIETIAEGIYSVHCDDLARLNSSLLHGFIDHQDEEDVERSHLFNNRYENIYLDESHVPELAQVMRQACRYAGNILQKQGLSAGYWFNYMPDGSITTLHRHDDDDELLSAAYYVSVPAGSGELIIHAKSGAVRIQPVEGSFIFFYPDVAHEVTKNRSGQSRLSIGINFGIRNTVD